MQSVELEFLARGESDTERLGRCLAECLRPGLVVSLTGNLGAGKTRLVQAVAAALGVDRSAVNSPTFVLLQEYDGRLPLYHFDTYRLRDTDEFLELGADELLFGDGVCLIEWGERVADVLPEDVLHVRIEATGDSERVFRLQGGGPRASEAIRELRRRLESDVPGERADAAG